MAIGWCAVRGHKARLSDLWGRVRGARDWRETRNGGRGEEQLLGDGMAYRLDGGEDLGTGFGIEFLSVEAE